MKNTLMCTFILTAYLMSCGPNMAETFPLQDGEYLVLDDSLLLEIKRDGRNVYYSTYKTEGPDAGKVGSFSKTALVEWSEPERVQKNIYQITLDQNPFTLLALSGSVKEDLSKTWPPRKLGGGSMGYFTESISESLEYPERSTILDERDVIQPDEELTMSDRLGLMGNYRIESISYKEGRVDWRTGLGDYNFSSEYFENASDDRFRVNPIVSVNHPKLIFTLLRSKGSGSKTLRFQPRELSLTSGLIWSSWYDAPAEYSEVSEFYAFKDKIYIRFGSDRDLSNVHYFTAILEKIPLD